MSLTSPLISVIIPAYNCETTIQDTLASVLNQSYSSIEIIVINDGSTDNTLKILNDVQDPRLRVLTFPNSGVSASRNRGITHSKGKFIALLDADDIWLPDKLAAQLEAFDQTPQVSVVYSWTDYIDQSGQLLRHGSYSRITGDVYQRLLMGSFLESGSNPLIRRDALEQVGGFDETLRTCEDWDLWIRLSSQYEFTVVPAVHVYYRISPNSKSFNFDKHEAGGLTVLDKAFAQAPDALKHLKNQSLSQFYKYLLMKLLDAPKTNRKMKRRRAVLAIKYLALTLYNRPALLQQTKMLTSILAKILLISLFPNQRPADLLTKLKQLQLA